MATQIQLQSTNYNGQLADITYYPCSGGTISLGYQTIPYTYTNDNYQGTYDLFFSAFSQTCQLVITCPTPTPTVTPTNTNTPTPTLTTTPTNTPTLTQTPTPSPGPAFDPDAAAYLAAVIVAGGTVNSTISGATNNMFLALKSNSLYSKMKAFYPVLGGIASSNKINGNLNTSFDLTFNGAFTHSYSGFNATTSSSYAATNYLPLTQHPSGNMTMGCFVNTNPDVNDKYIMAVYETGAKAIGWGYALTNAEGYFTQYGSSLLILNGGTPNQKGFMHIGGDATTRYFSQNLTGVDTNVSLARNGSGLPNLEIYLSNLNFIGAPYSTQTGRVAFAYMSDYLTTAETTTLSSIINAFQTSLGRNYF
jgi:hypothetical protein